ncbi:amidase [Xylariaceae sp. FL0016]|nr:amidase [Xylariaceae sp. FL0016]
MLSFSMMTTNSSTQELRLPETSHLPLPTQWLERKLNGVSVYEITVSELQNHFVAGTFTSSQYVERCLENIRLLNPYLEAVLETRPDAVAIAEELDTERWHGRIRGPLHGIPVLVKDNIATEGPMQTTAGSWALLGSIVPKDAFVITKLRAAGAVILGHANMSEWASLRSKAESTGFGPRGGQTRNPFDLRRSALGSSSGSAATVSANLAPLALGTETDTSIIGPASINGVVGIKPTVGLTSRTGVIPISENMDSVGPFGRTVADAVALLDAIVEQDVHDRFAMVPNRKQDVPYSRYLSTPEVLKGARFGLPWNRCWDLAPSGSKRVATKVLDAMRKAGAEILDVNIPSIEERSNESGTWNWEHGDAAQSEWTVAQTDAYDGINSYLQGLIESPVKSIEDIIRFNRENAGTEGGFPGIVPAFPDGQTNLHEVAQRKGLKDETYDSALAHIRRQTRQNGIDAALSHVQEGEAEPVRLDALIFCDRRGIGQQYAAQVGYPVICIPIGLDNHGMPISISIQHTAWKEAELVKWASAIDSLWAQESGPRAKPTFRNLHAKNIPVEEAIDD